VGDGEPLPHLRVPRMDGDDLLAVVVTDEEAGDVTVEVPVADLRSCLARKRVDGHRRLHDASCCQDFLRLPFGLVHAVRRRFGAGAVTNAIQRSTSSNLISGCTGGVLSAESGSRSLGGTSTTWAIAGFQRTDGTEPFGYEDGVRNVARNDRTKVVYVDCDRFPEEPDWTESGTYLAFMRMRQDVDAFNAIPADEQDRVIGRTRDGRRLDLPEGSDPRDEPEIPAEHPPTSHVRKAGPRGADNDTVQIFRRGLPFIEAGADGVVRTGLLFASFQASLDHFRVVFNRWMLNRNFPPPPPGRQDDLFERSLVAIDRWGYFFVPGDSDEPLGTEMLAPKDKKPHKSPKPARSPSGSASSTRTVSRPMPTWRALRSKSSTALASPSAARSRRTLRATRCPTTCRPTSTSSSRNSRRRRSCSRRSRSRSDWSRTVSSSGSTT